MKQSGATRQLWQEIREKRSNNTPLRQRIEACAAMISACLDCEASDKEKTFLIGRIVRVSSEIGPFRRTADGMSKQAILFVEENAATVLRKSGIKRRVVPTHLQRELHHEHVVPCSFLTKSILSARLSADRITQELLSSGIRCIVSVDEQKKLDAKLRTKMPENWKLGDNPFSRYEAAGVIDLIIKPDDIDP